MKVDSKKNNCSELPVVVGIVSAADNTNVLCEFLRNFSSDCGAAFVVARQNLPVQYQDCFVQGGYSRLSLPVVELSNGLRIQKNNIYIPPAGFHVVVKNGLLYLIKTDELENTEIGADIFFSSLSESFPDRVVGMFLNGTDAFEGMACIDAVKESGGITIFHNEQPARYAAVKFSSFKSRSIDLFLPLEKLGKELVDIVRYKESLETYFDRDSTLENIFNILKLKKGVNFNYYKRKLIIRHIKRRMAINKIQSLEDYTSSLENTPEEVEFLFTDILISSNSFFRSENFFNLLSEKILPEIIEKKQKGDKIRFWVPGCSSGEQAYILAIAVSMFLGKQVQDYNIKIFATDVNNSAVKAARNGIYPKRIVSYVLKEILDKYFTLTDKGYQVNQEIRGMVFFSHQDIINAPPFSNLDLVHFTNSFRYFKHDIQNRILQLFHYALNPSGFLFAEGSEAEKQIGELFDPVDKQLNLFRSKPIIYEYNLYFPGAENLPRIQIEEDVKITQKCVSLSDVVDKIIKKNYSPPSVIINEIGEILHIHGDVNQYIQFIEGRLGTNIFNVARQGFPINIRLALRRVNEEGKPVTVEVASFKNKKKSRLIAIHVHPVTVRNWGTKLFLILFSDITPKEGFRINPPIIDASQNTSFVFSV